MKNAIRNLEETLKLQDSLKKAEQAKASAKSAFFNQYETFKRQYAKELREVAHNAYSLRSLNAINGGYDTKLKTNEEKREGEIACKLSAQELHALLIGIYAKIDASKHFDNDGFRDAAKKRILLELKSWLTQPISKWEELKPESNQPAYHGAETVKLPAPRPSESLNNHPHVVSCANVSTTTIEPL